MSTRAATDTEWSDAEELATHRAVLFKRCVEAGAAACARGDFESAVRLYEDAIELDPTNHVLYSNRSAIYCKLCKFESALNDAVKSYELKPSWNKALYRKGYALKCMGQYVQALQAYSMGLAQDPKNRQLLLGLIECFQQCPLKERFSNVYDELKSLGYDKNAFVLISVVGQELLSSGNVGEAVEILENALKIDTTNLELKQSVLSALSSAYWTLGSMKKALQVMEQDLAIALSLGNVTSEARARSNLGMVHLAVGNLNEALNNYRHHLMLSLRAGDKRSAAFTLSTMGQIYLRLFDYKNSLASFEQCLDLMNDCGGEVDDVDVYRQYGHMGDVYLSLGREKDAERMYDDHLKSAKRDSNVAEEARALMEIGSLWQFRGNMEQAGKNFLSAHRSSRQCHDRTLEMHLCGHLCQICLNLRDFDAARRWSEKQLQLALILRDTVGESKSCANLGAVEFQRGNVENAKKIFQRQLDVAKSSSNGDDKNLILKAYRNLGLCNEHLKLVRDAIECHTTELCLAKEINDKTSECMAHGYLASLYQSLDVGDHSQTAETHLQCHWTLAKESANAKTESTALRNVGKFYAKCESYERSVEYFEKFLMLAQERNDVDAEKEACRELGVVHRATGRYREAVRYFDQELALAKDLRDHRTMALAYRDLGLARASLNEFDEAMECQKYFLALAHISHESEMKLQALQNIGDVLLKRQKYGVALKIFCKQLNLAKACKSRAYESTAYGKIGESYDFLNKFERARQCYGEQLRIARDIDDVRQQFDVYGRLAKHYRRYKNVSSAVHAYENQIERARTMKNVDDELDALKNLCDLCRETNMYDDATRYMQERLKLLAKSTSTPRRRTSFKRALLDLAKFYQTSSNVVDALKIYDEHLTKKNVDEDDDVETAECILAFGRLWFKVGNFNRAEESFSYCYDLFQSSRFVSEPAKLCEIRLDSILCDVATKNFEIAAEKTKDLLKFSRKFCLVRYETKILLIYARILIYLKDTTSAMNAAKEATSLCRRFDDVDLNCGCLSFFATMKSFDDDFAGARMFFQQIFDVSTNRNVDKWKLYGLQRLASVSLANRDYDSARQLLNQSINLAVSTNDLASEVEIRTTLALIFWSQRRFNEAKNELESGLRIVEKRSFYLNLDTFMDVGETPLRLPETLCMLLMVLLTAMNLEQDVLIIVEKLRYFRFVSSLEKIAVDARKRLNVVPNRETVEERINYYSNGVVLYYFSMENYLFSWNFQKSSRQFNVKRVEKMNKFNDNDSSSNGFLTFSSIIIRKLALDLINSTYSVLPTMSTLADCLNDDVNRLGVDCDRLIIIGVNEKINFGKISTLIVRDSSLTNFAPKLQTIPSQMLTSGVVVDSLETFKSTSIAASALNVDVIHSSSLYKEELLSKMSKCLCIHLNLRLNSTFDGFLLKSSKNFVDNSSDLDVSSGDDDDDDEQILACPDVLKQNIRACVAVLTIEIDDELSKLKFLNDFAVALTLSGCKSVVFFRSGHSDDVRATFFRRFYDLTSKKESIGSALMDACRQSDVPFDDIVLYGNADAVLDQCFAQTSRPFHLLLQTPDECREAMLVVLHLVEKSLQRINAGLTTPMFTSELSVRNKAGPEVSGVFELLEALGFHREASRTKNVSVADETALYFPLNDASGCLSRGSFVLQAFLSLPQGMYVAFSKLTKAKISIVPLLKMLEKIGEDICSVQKIHKFEIKLNRTIYSISGAAELFAALGFDKLKEDSNETILETIRIELTNKKLQNTLICFHAVFGDVVQRFSSVDSIDERRETTNADRSPMKQNSVSVSNLPLNGFKSRDFDLPTDLSGVDSDFPLDESLWAMSLERPTTKKKHHRPGKWKKSNSKNLSGYLSEGDLKGKKMLDPRSTARGYHSEDENKPRSLSTSKRDDSMENALDFATETTAQVISVDERSSPFNDLGFHDDADDLPAAPPIPPASPPPTAPPPLPYKHHEYARLETPQPSFVAGRRCSPNSCRSSPTTSTGRLRPPSCRPPPPPYDCHLRNKGSPLAFGSVRTTPASTPTPMETNSDADVMRRAAQKLVFQRHNGQNSSFNGGKTHSTSPYNVPNDHIVIIPSSDNRVLTNGSHSGAFTQRNIHENRMILAREDSFPAEFI